jgi:hypothetical protein
LDVLSPADAADLKKALQAKKRELAKAMKDVDRGIAKLKRKKGKTAKRKG